MLVENKIKKVFLGVVGICLISHSIFFWMISFQYPVSLFENGPTAAFTIEQLLTLGYLVSIILFLLGIMALFKAVYCARRKTSI